MNLLTYHAKKLLGKLPAKGDDVWWSSKGVAMTVTEVKLECFIARGGDPVTIKPGKVIPRWTLMVPHENTKWDEKLRYWLVGQGPLPTVKRDGTVIIPNPVVISIGRANG